MAARWYIGLWRGYPGGEAHYDAFRSVGEPSQHGEPGRLYNLVTGPFRTKRDAACAAYHGQDRAPYVSTAYRACERCTLDQWGFCQDRILGGV